MHDRIFRALAGASLGLLLVSCGDDEGGNGLTPGTTVPPTAVEGAVGTVVSMAFSAGYALNFGFNSINFSATPGSIRSRAAADLVRIAALQEGGVEDPRLVALLSSPDCTPTESGGEVDSDADGIPDDLTVEYTAANCTVTDTSTGSYQLIRGRVRYRDIPGALHGFEMVFEGMRRDELDGTDGTWFTRTTTSRERAEVLATGGTWTLESEVTASNGFGAVVQNAGTTVREITATYAPGATIPADGPLPDGVFRISGRVDETSLPHGRLIWEMVTPLDLDYATGCSGPDAGKVEMRLNGDPTEGILVKFIGCGDFLWEFLGSGVL